MSRDRSITAADLAGVTERLATSRPLKRMGNAAEAYARLGLRVIPLHHLTPSGCSCGKATCRDAGKHPRTRRGVTDATSSIETIRAWWFSHPDANIGIATGHLVDVIDIDTSAAEESVADLRAADRIPSVIAAATSGRIGGGTHLYVAVTGAGCAKPPVDGVDFRGRGGYVVAAPSVHASGATYVWQSGPMKVGDPRRGKALGAMPWEKVTVPVGQPGRREYAYAMEMLSRQERQVAASLPGRRIPRLLSAGNNLGSVVAAGWIGEREVMGSLLNAYRRANGVDEHGAHRAVIDGLFRGRGLRLPALGEALSEDGDPRRIIDGITAWMNSPRSRVPGLVRGRVATLGVLQGVLERADELGQACVPVSVRDAQMWGGYASTSPASKALKRLGAVGVVTEEKGRARGAGAANRFRLRLPDGAETTCNLGEQDTVGVSEASTTPCAPRLQSGEVATHSLWGHRRGETFGLTRNDRLLFANAQAEAGLVVEKAQWAKNAGVSRKMLIEACSDRSGTLVDLGLVEPIERGRVALTALGADLAAAVQGQTDITVLDQLALDLGVSTRQQEREDSIAVARREDRQRLTPKMVRALIAGRLATPRVPAILSEVLGTVATDATSAVCAALDASAQQRQSRAAMESVLTSLERWGGDPGTPICSRSTIAALHAWLTESDATDVDSEVSLLAEAWWQTRGTGHGSTRGAQEVAARNDALVEHRDEVARALIHRGVRIARCTAPPAGYTAGEVNVHRREVA